jgi:hypothetical protein
MSDLLVVTYDFTAHTNAASAQVNQNFTDVETYINSRFGNAASAQMWLANGSGVATPRTLSGDATISNTGVLTIAANAITSSKLNAGAVTNGKLNLSYTQITGSNTVLSPTFQEIANTSPSPPTAGDYLVFSSVVASGSFGTSLLTGRLEKTGGTQVGPSPATDLGDAITKYSTLSWSHALTLNGTDNLKLMAKANGTGTATTDSRLLLIRIA